MQVCGRFLRMYRLCGGGGVTGGRPKPHMVFPHSPHHQLGHAPSHRAPPHTRKKTWSFIQDLSYDTFFTMKRLIERSRQPDEVLRWLSQNPSKVSQSHLAVALQRIAQLLPASPHAAETSPPCMEATPLTPEGGAKADRKQMLEHQDFQSLCDAIIRDCSKLDNFSLVTCLYATASLGLSPDSSLVGVLESECERRVAHFNQKDLSMVFSSVMRLHQGPFAVPRPHAEPPHRLLAEPPHRPLAEPPHRPLAEPPDPPTSHLPEPAREPQTEAPAAEEHAPFSPPVQQGPEPQGPVQQGPEPQGPEPQGPVQQGPVQQGPEPQGPEPQGPEPRGRALTEACLSGLERSLERERHPQTLFLLLAYYRGRWRELHSQSRHSSKDTPTAAANQELLLTNRKILRLVKHTLSCVSAVRDQEMALLDEMLAACAAEASNRSLELIFSSHLFHQSRQERFITRLAEELPQKMDGLSPNTMALIAKYTARHRLRETRLLDTLSEYLLKRAESLDTKVIQRLVFPLSRMNYRPQNAPELFLRLEKVLEPKALSSPLATVNILMSLLQLHFCSPALLRTVFCPGFIQSLQNSPYLAIVRRYLSLLDSAVDLEFGEYSGPRLSPVHKVLMFDQALTADEANRKYSYKGLVAEALRQLLGENYKQDQVLQPGYYTDFLLWIDSCRRVVPIGSVRPCDSTAWALDSSGLAVDFHKFSLEAEPSDEALPVGDGTCLHHITPFYSTDYGPNKDQEIHRVVLSVNDKWHYCHNSEVLVGSRAMRDRHLHLLGFKLLQLPYHELEKLNGIEEVKSYLQQKLLDLPL